MNKGVDQIIARIAQDISKLKNGELTVSELGELTDLSRELYEILLVTRYQKSNSHTLVVDSVEKEDVNTETIEKTEEREDIIEESNSDLLFDFTGTQTKEEKTPEPEPIFELNTEESKTIQTPVEPVEEESTEKEEVDASVNTNYQDNFSNSIANKMQLTPISNLTGHISLNQRFLFIANLFGNNAEDYNAAVASIDKMDSGNTAKEVLNSYQQKYGWDLENKDVIDFVTLVERRFI